MSRSQNLLLITCLALVAIISTYTYLAKQNSSNIWYSPGQVSQGQILYLDHCAGCHGTQAQGAENWTQLDSNGNRPAPPLNGSGHAWHHSLADLTQTVTQGRGTMPAWKDTLTEEEIMAILASVQSRWPTTIYTAWSKANP
jgi:mono/diheme cytochrome c family protein